MAEKRLFVGVSIDAENQKDLLETIRKLRIGADKKELRVKWVPPENWHITLKFIGTIPEGRIPRLIERLDQAASQGRRTTLRASGVGAFPEPQRARIIWAGVSSTQELLDLQTAVDEVFFEEGFDPEEREFHPHVTLGRLRSAGSVRDLISPFERKRFTHFVLNELILYESVQQGPFPVYIPLYRAPIQGAPHSD